ncbi:NAD-dependent epimerase/dehydratase family protein [Candidatus Woesearchaeota archaeon]|nr:NAD-dependent epimerase/dehydratase family protein [Candidatus Woesearchaeota archaeon]
MNKRHNCDKTCWNCPAAILKGNVDFRACGQSKEEIKKKVEENPNLNMVIECARRPELGHFEPNITFEQCPEWIETKYGYMLKEMRVMILGIDGYLGWPLALKLSKLGFKVAGVDNYWRRDMVMEKGSHTAVPIQRMTQRLQSAKEILGTNIEFRKIDIRTELDKLREFMEEFKPESIVHYAEIPSAPYSMVDCNHALKVQDNNTLGSLGVLFAMKDIVPESSMVKLGTMGEYGAPLTGRPIFEGMFPADAVLQWDGREWSMGGEMTPRNPGSFYHVGKVQDTYNVYEACRYWWLRSYDIMQGVIYGVHTKEMAEDKRLRTRFDFDEWFGTVINRFVAQAVLGIPLTIYGKGEQIRGFIGLEDAMQCMIRLIISPPEPGQYDVVNQVSAVYRIVDLAEAVAEVGKEFGIDVKIQRLENPRVEPDKHPMEVVSKKLEGEFGLDPKIRLKEEVRRMFKVLTNPEVKKRLEEKKHVVLPKTRWNGDKLEMDKLDEYEPGTKKFKLELKQQLDTIHGNDKELKGIKENGN